jgi:hypothetical protein
MRHVYSLSFQSRSAPGSLLRILPMTACFLVTLGELLTAASHRMTYLIRHVDRIPPDTLRS